MKSRAPENYICPICLGVSGIESSDTLLKKADLVYKDELISVFLNSFWIKTVEAHVIIVSNDHIENLYEMPSEIGNRIFEVSKMIAIALKKAYKCDGITLRQNNEPAGDQHAFHYYLHVFPRYDGDKFNQGMTSKSILSDPNDRVAYVQRIKDHLVKIN